MGRKQTVYLSEDTARRLRRFRDVINISAISSAAIERELDRLEAALDGKGNIDELSSDQLRSLVKTLLSKREGVE